MHLAWSGGAGLIPCAVATLKQIAAEAGVHITTVAVVLNSAGGNTRVGRETRERIGAVASRLGYSRNESARRLRTGTSNAVAFLGGDLRNPFFSELASALELELSRQNLELVISHVAGGHSSELAHRIESLRQQAVKKIIVWDESGALKFSDLSVQVLPIGFTVTPRPGVWLDLQHAIRLAVAELVQRGFRQLGFYSPRDQSESPSVAIRQRMFVEECRRCQLPKPRIFTYEGESWSIEAAAKGAALFLDARAAGEGFVGFNDIAALGILLASATFRQPPTVIGFDGTPLIRSWPGSPVYLDLHLPEFARRAAEAVAGAEQSVNQAWLQPSLSRRPGKDDHGMKQLARQT